MTLRRSGGIAGFDDTVVLETSGEIRVETRTIHGRVCRLGKSQQSQLFAMLATLRRGGPASAPSQQPDVIHISLTDAQDRPFDLSDPSLGSVSDLVGALVSDVTLTVPSTVTCKTAG